MQKRRVLSVAGVALAFVALVGAKGCSEKECSKLSLAVDVACAGQESLGAFMSSACVEARDAYRQGCSTPIPIPTPTPTPTPTPDPPVVEPPDTDPPVDPTVTPGDRFPSGLPTFELIEGARAHLGDAVSAAGYVVLGCALGSAGCEWSVPPVLAMDFLAEKLRSAGYDAGRYDDDHSGLWSGSDSLAVAVHGSGIWEEWAVFNYGIKPNGKNDTAFRFMGAFRLVGAPEPECLSLSWIKLDVQDGKAKRHINATPQHRGAADCAGIGYAGRESCPLGPEGGTLRPFCEAKHAPWVWTVTPDPGWDLAPEQDTGLPNPLVIKLEARQEGTAKVCSADGICGELVTR